MVFKINPACSFLFHFFLGGGSLKPIFKVFVQTRPNPCPAPFLGDLLWMDEILHHVEPMRNHCFVGIYGGIIIPGFLRWCRISSIHSVSQGILAEGTPPSGA